MKTLFHVVKSLSHYFIYISVLLIATNVVAQSSKTFTGLVLDAHGNPLEFASIALDNNQVYYTNSTGHFSFSTRKEFEPFSIHYANKKSIYIKDLKTYHSYNQSFTMIDLSITLEEINITAPIHKAQSGSNSAIIIDREKISEAQAFSLKDVLNTLPGHATVAPNLNTAQTINLRGGSFDKFTGGTLQQMNNSFGVAIIIDDVTISNDANMQTRSLNQFGLTNASNTGSIANLTYQGVDLREIPVENIESIEVVQGVASAKYGELTDGAIIINKQAGRTPYSFTTNINRGATSYSLSKGFGLPNKWGAINLSVNYSKSNNDPRDNIKEYNRINQSILWTKSFSSNVKNNLSFSFSKRLDGVREDPDDQQSRKLKATDEFFRWSNRTSVQFNSRIIKSLNINLNGSYGISNTYNQERINKGPFPVANRDTTGVYEGYYVDGRYIAVEEIQGRPLSLGSTLNVSSNTFGNKFEHLITAGISLNYHDNLGKGTIYKADQPRWFQNNNQNERPYDFRRNEGQADYGIYIMDNFKSYLFNKPLDGNIGFRTDIQNGKVSYQPRVNIAYQLTPNSRLTLGYGIASKSPSLAHRYPAPIWLDFPLLNFFDDSNINNSLYLVKTVKIESDNNHLKPSTSSQFEVGYTFSNKFLTNNFFGYFKDNKNGFGVKKEYFPIDVPEYRVIGELEKGKPIEYEATGNYNTLTNYSIRRMTNSVRSKSFGFDWTVSTQKIKPLNMYVSLSNSLSYSEYYDQNPTYNEISEESYKRDYGVYYTVFYPAKTKSLSLMSKLRLTYHIPKIGFIITMNSDIFWFRKSLNTEQKYANEYLDVAMQPIKVQLPEDIQQTISTAGSNYEQPTFYVINLNATKEIRKNIRIGINTYNFFNIRINKEKKLSDGTRSVINYNAPFSITGSISIKF
ncbi:TonB-dependent receptor [Myroides albus]|uniref:TonB-dependent receptor n=1 Tax=Myroides albus TaxID=2562892 RepID=UPI002158E5AC|nr:TonB-dependent receptor [Myroides albus]UVD78931.1 TonB-dependent receptor [Myroides albus]